MERFGEQALLVVVRAGSVGGDEQAESLGGFGAEEIAKEEQAAGCRDADRFAEDMNRLGNVMDDAVRHDDIEHAVGEGQPLGIDVGQLDAVA